MLNKVLSQVPDLSDMAEKYRRTKLPPGRRTKEERLSELFFDKLKRSPALFLATSCFLPMLHHILHSCFESWLPTVFFLVGVATTIALEFYLLITFFSKDELGIGDGPFITGVQ